MRYRFEVTQEEQGLRLDMFLQQRIAGISRGTLRKVIDIGGVHVGGRRARKNGMSMTAGDSVELNRDDQALDPFRLRPELILFQDAYLVAVNKPAGIDTQPTPARYKGTLYEALQVWLGRDRRFGRKLEIGMVQRLDRDTSGVIVFSIHPIAHKSLSEQFALRRAGKQYLTLVCGCPESSAGELRGRLIRDRRGNRMRAAESGGRDAVSRYRVLASAGSMSVLLIELVTGRTHQIRAQCAEAGFPLVGDVRYGGPAERDGATFARPMLHSWRVALIHPRGGAPMTLEAPLPEDLAAVIDDRFGPALTASSVLEAVDRCRHPSAPGDKPA